MKQPIKTEVFTLSQGDSPVMLSLPHVGTWLPAPLLERLAPRAVHTEDTDWHLARLYDFAQELGVTLLVPRANRYLIDLNRPPENTPMYPGANNTELCPTHFFTGEPLYQAGQEPNETEVQTRVEQWWRPYHQALSSELARIKAMHGHVVLFDGHSIRSQLPWLFEGRLWDLNLGTASGASCAPGLRQALMSTLGAQQRYSHVTDGRFKGGHITRHYGQPSQGVHAVQLEMTWSCYMQEAPPYAWDELRAAGVRPLLQSLVGTMLEWRPS